MTFLSVVKPHGSSLQQNKAKKRKPRNIQFSGWLWSCPMPKSCDKCLTIVTVQTTTRTTPPKPSMAPKPCNHSSSVAKCSLQTLLLKMSGLDHCLCRGTGFWMRSWRKQHQNKVSALTDAKARVKPLCGAQSVSMEIRALVDSGWEAHILVDETKQHWC